jgi:hypothetical protein
VSDWLTVSRCFHPLSSVRCVDSALIGSISSSPAEFRPSRYILWAACYYQAVSLSTQENQQEREGVKVFMGNGRQESKGGKVLAGKGRQEREGGKCWRERVDRKRKM